MVAASQTIGTSGGRITAAAQGETYVISVPAGDFTAPTQVTVYAPTDLSAIKAIAGIEIVFSDPSTGAPLPGTTLPTPITVAVNAPDVAKGDVVEVFNGTGFVTYAGSYTTTAGSATIEMTADPTFAVAPPAQAAAPGSPSVPGATSIDTGEPFLGEEIVAGAAAAAGLVAVGAALSLRRRRSA